MSQLSPKFFPPPQSKRDADVNTALSELVTELRKILNGGLLIPDNFAAKTVTFTSSATPDAENVVAHTLGKVPVGYIVYGRDKAGVLYSGTTAWTTANIYLKSNIASVEYKIIVF
jgi:hypothetical protein